MYSGKCWMVQNSKEGNASATKFDNDDSRVNGYYYAREDAATACPTGWHLPSYDEATGLISEINEEDRTAEQAKWWAGTQGAANGAFAGGYNGASWNNWGNYGNWWYNGSGNQYFHGSIDNMTTSSYPNHWFSVRCVRD